MNKAEIATHLVSAYGIEAVLVDDVFNSREPDFNVETLKITRTMVLNTRGDVRVVFGRLTLVGTMEDGVVVVVALPTGHSIAKSLRRMIRRAVRRGGAPKLGPERGASAAKLPSREVGPASSSKPIERGTPKPVTATGRTPTEPTLQNAPIGVTVPTSGPEMEAFGDALLRAEPVKPESKPAEPVNPDRVGGVRSW